MTRCLAAPFSRCGWRALPSWLRIGFLLLLGAAQPALAHLQDGFERADAAVLGDGWMEKNPAAFALVGGRAAKQTVGTGYRDNLVYRPATEDVLNVEAAVEVQFTGAPGYAQLAVRVQSATAANANAFDGYLLYVNNSNTQVILGRQNGTAFVTTLATLALSAPFNTTDRFRLRLRASGTNPVALDAFVERLDGVIWNTIGQASFSDASAQRVASAGSVGFGGYTEATYAFDNFTRVDLNAVGTANPAPTLAALEPNQAYAGELGVTVLAYGSGFTTDSRVLWNGETRPTTYVSPSELEATIGAADVASAGTANIGVSNPTPGGGTSATLPFNIVNETAPAPTITALTPSSTTAGSPGFTLTVTGTGFNSSAVVRWNGADRITSYASSTQLLASITSNDVASAGTASVTVLRTSDGLASGPSTFTIDAPIAGDFVDAFTRADSAAIGNAWIEKADAAFSLAANEVSKSGSGAGDYRNNIVYRPAAEDTLDVEAAVEIRFTSTPPGYPSLFVRGQSASIATAGQLDAYLLYLNNSNTQAVLSRQRGGNYDTALAVFTLNTAINTTDRFRLRLRATGTNPVALEAYVERWGGTAWQIIGQATASDASAERISAAGSVGFGGYIETNYRLDNFSRTAVGTSVPNPVPAITGLSPSSVAAGSGALTLMVNGSNFVTGSVVRWNGADRTTTFVSATQLQAAITSADTANAGTANVTVFNPAPGGGTSAAATFSITASGGSNPVPVATSLSPSSAAAGGGAFTLTVNGSNFVTGSVVRWNGANRTTTYVSASQLTAAIPATDIATAGPQTVTVFNPTPGGGTSGGLTFTVTSATNPVPTATGLSPSSVPAGSPAFTLTVNGSNFVSGSIVRWNGSDRATTFVSSSQLTAAIAAGDIATQGSRTVTVFNPAPGGGTSGGLTFTVSAPATSNPVPVLTSTSPTSWPAGGSAFTLTVLGSSFTLQSVVHWNGSPRPTTVVSANELRASIDPGDVAAPALPAVTVVTPGPGGGWSAPVTFFVQDGAIQYTYDNFNRPNSPDIGNGWTEKNPGAFELLNGEVPSQVTSGGFTQDIMYRPQSEQRLNMEVSAEFRRLTSNVQLDQANYPQIHARVQSSSVVYPWTLDSYIFFIDDSVQNPSRAMFAITTAPSIGARYECYIAPLPLPAPLVVGERYRLRFRVSGVAPVTLWGAVDQYSNGSWTMIASGTVTHDSTTQRDPTLYCDGTVLQGPLTNPGVAGIAKWTNRTDVYDNFYVRDLGAAAAAPTVSSLSPASAAAGSADLVLTVNGSGFAADTTVRWNGITRPTQYVSPTQVRAAIPAADLALSGISSVTVGGNETAESAALLFTVTPASGTLTLSDTFSRANDPAVGNGWLEKVPAAFYLQSNRAFKAATPNGDYRNNLVYRPAGEDRRDVEALMEFRVETLPIGYPSLLTRVQQSSVNTNGQFAGYMLFMDASTTLAVLARQDLGGGYETRLGQFNLSTALVAGGTYRMRLRTVGTTSVTVQGAIERLNSAGRWEVIGQGTATDTSAARITNPGSVGFTGYIENAYTFDNFQRVDFGQ